MVEGPIANFGISLWRIFSVFQKNRVLGYSWSTLLWHRCHYPHGLRDALSPVCGIFFLGFLRFSDFFYIFTFSNFCCVLLWSFLLVFWDFFGISSDFLNLFGFLRLLGFLDFFLDFLRFLFFFKITKFTTKSYWGYYWTPKWPSQNSIKNGRPKPFAGARNRPA